MKVIFHHILLQPFVPDIHEGLTNVLSFGYVCQFTLNMRFLLISYKKSTVLLRPVRLCLCPFDTSLILISYKKVLSFRLCLCPFDTSPILISYKKSTVLLRPVRLCLCPFDTSPILNLYFFLLCNLFFRFVIYLCACANLPDIFCRHILTSF